MLRDYGDPIPEPQLSVEAAMTFNSESLAAYDEPVPQPETVVGTVEVAVELTRGKRPLPAGWQVVQPEGAAQVVI